MWTTLYEADSYPFGGERVITNALSDANKFAGMYRDEEADPDLAPSPWRVSEYYRCPPGDRN